MDENRYMVRVGFSPEDDNNYYYVEAAGRAAARAKVQDYFWDSDKMQILEVVELEVLG